MSHPCHPRIQADLVELSIPEVRNKGEGPRLQQINIAIPGFLDSPPPKGTQQVELPTQCVTREEAISLHPTSKEETFRVIEVTDFEKDFKVFDQSPPIESPHATFSHLPTAQVSNNQEPSGIPKAMVL